MRNVSYIIISLILLGCGNLPKGFIDPYFTPYVDSFKSSANYYGKTLDVNTLSIHWSDKMEPNTLGLCHYDSNTITINSIAWPSLSPLQQEVLMYHEMGHCLLMKQHSNHGIMTEYIYSDSYYTPHYLEYIAELFE